MHPALLLYAVRQVGVHITLSVVLFFGNFGGQNQQRLSPLQGTGRSLCIFPRHQPYHSLCRGCIHAARVFFRLGHKTAGTNCSRPPMAHQAPAFPENSNKKYPAASCEVFCGAPSGTRTQDPLIKSQLLSLVANTKVFAPYFDWNYQFYLSHAD